MTCVDGETRDAVELYSRLAPSYDLLHRRWLKYAGGEAQAALEAAVRGAYRPGAALLDVGCGTGAFARALLSEGVAAEDLTLLDPSAAMLSRCADLPCLKVPGRIEAHCAGILAAGAACVTLGGDHSITLPLLRAHAAKHGPLAFIQVDDLRPLASAANNLQTSRRFIEQLRGQL